MIWNWKWAAIVIEFCAPFSRTESTYPYVKEKSNRWADRHQNDWFDLNWDKILCFDEKEEENAAKTGDQNNENIQVEEAATTAESGKESTEEIEKKMETEEEQDTITNP